MRFLPQRPLPHTLRWFGKALYIALLVVASVFIMINVHEIGHTVFARLLGDGSASYALYRLHPDGSIRCIGCNAYNPHWLSFFGNVIVPLGGVIFSQGLALALLWYKRKVKGGAPCGRFCAVLTVVCVSDAAFQVAQGLAANIGQQTGLTGVDIADFIWLVASHTHLGPVLLKAALAAALLVYLGWFIKTYRKPSIPA